VYPLANVLGPLGHRPYSLPWSSGSSLLTGLVSWWNLDETSGTRADAVGSNDLTDNNTVGYAAGKIGNAASFVVANTEYLSKTTPSLPTGTMYSCGWIKTVGTQNNDGCWSQNTATSNSCWGLMFVGNVPYWRTQAGASTVDLIWAGGAVSAGDWHFIEGYFDPANDKVGLAVDGSAWQTSAQAGADTLDNTGNAFWIGGYWGTAYTIDADIDLVGVWSRVLTADERTELYNAGASIKNAFTDNGEGFREGLIAYYKMEEESGPRVNAAAPDALKRGLIHRWSLDEESGTREDSISGLTLTDVNTVGFATGKDGNAASFTYADSDKLTAASIVLPDSWSMAMWVNFRGASPVGGQGVLGCIGSWPNNMQAALYAGTNNTIYCIMGDGVTYYYATGYIPPTAPNLHEHDWFHLAVTFAADTGLIHVWIDGEDHTNHASVPVPVGTAYRTATPLDIGKHTAYSSARIDDVEIYNRALTPAEIAAKYAAGAGTFYPYADASVYDLTDINTVGFAAGKSGNAANVIRANSEGLVFDFATGMDDVLDGDNFTYGCWAKIVELDTRYVRLMSLGTGYSNMYTYTTSPGGRIQLTQFWFADDGGWAGSGGGWADQGDHTAWHHFAVVYSVAGGFCRFYLDGVQKGVDGPATGMAWHSVTGDIRIGHNGAGTDSSGAIIDEAFFSNRAWSLDEITGLYASQAGRFYDFNTL